MNFLFLDGASGNAVSEIGLRTYEYWNSQLPYNSSSVKNYSNKIEIELGVANNILLEDYGVLFTHKVDWNSGATESIYSLLINGFLNRTYDTLIYPKEGLHPTAISCIDQIELYGCNVIPVKTNSFGVFNLNDLESKVSTAPVSSKPLLYLEHIVGLTGSENNLEKISEIVRSRKGLQCIIDITQSLGKTYPVNLDWCSCIFGSVHKFGGFKGLGLLIHNGTYMPIIGENNRRKGTLDHPAIFGSIESYKQAKTLNWKELLINKISMWEDIPELVDLESGHSHIKLFGSRKLESHQINALYRNVIVGYGSACTNGLFSPPMLYKKLCSKYNLKSVIRLSV